MIRKEINHISYQDLNRRNSDNKTWKNQYIYFEQWNTKQYVNRDKDVQLKQFMRFETFTHEADLHKRICTRTVEDKEIH